MLEVKNAKMMYGDLVAVDHLSFTLEPGAIFGLLGTNGAGKTTTFRMIMGLLEPTDGEVLLDGHAISYADVNDIGYMIEERSLLTKVTVKELMLYFGQLKDMEPTVILERLDYWLKRFDIVDYKDKKVKELSKGNQQKIQFIAALINNPRLLVLDEPFSGLDPINTELFVDVIYDFKKRGAMVVFSSHQLDHVEQFCEEVIVLEKGKAVIEGKLSDVKKAYKKHKIKIIGDFDVEKIKEIPGVYDVEKNLIETIVRIENEAVSKAVFDYIKTCDHIIKYDVEQASLSEIFKAKVGRRHEKI